MKRRDFLNLTAGSAVAVMAPLPRIATAAPAAVVPKNLYVWAVAMAQAGNPISHTTLGQALKVSPDQASALMGKLAARGVIAVPNAAGVARAVDPMFRANAAVPEVVVPQGLDERPSRWRKFIDSLAEENDVPDSIEPETIPAQNATEADQA